MKRNVLVLIFVLIFLVTGCGLVRHNQKGSSHKMVEKRVKILAKNGVVTGTFFDQA